MNITLNQDGFIDKLLFLYDRSEISSIASIVFGYPITLDTIDKRIKIVEEYKKILEELRKIPKIEQRTAEWYNARQTLITASDFAQALGEGKFGTQKQFIQKKCGFEEDKFDNSAAALRWGCMFEEIACKIYSQRNNCKVYDFGLIRHPTIDYFGASPDGVTENGIMVEIKCPWKRKIDGTVPMQYFYQIQGQLDVCGLDECDYWECEFIDSENPEDLFTTESFEKGVILEEHGGEYIYAPVYHRDVDPTILIEWVNENKTPSVVKVHYYALIKCSNVRVYKDPEFLKDRLVKLGEVWDKIKTYRADEELYNKEIKTAPKENPYKLKGFSFINM